MAKAKKAATLGGGAGAGGNDAAQAAFVEARPFSSVLAADPRVREHLDASAVDAK